MGKKKVRFHCKSEAQKKAITKSYAKKAVGKKNFDKSGKKKEKFPHFRYYKKSGHPALIVGEQLDKEQDEEYRFRKVMHREYDGKNRNEFVYPNPDPTDDRPMYIGKRVRHDKKKFFDSRVLPWIYRKGNKKSSVHKS